ncbi:MAG TPA: prepilin-type N-terminal cleavage/methylation domain-containing protein, partial [Planctomycetota bacterium]|nr:prepilin-type N-terminal cleavage/methylation domain-containing protein [Planctomycetota bacterium]
MRARTRGMTLLEIMVAVAVFSVVMVAVMLMGWSTSAKYSNSESASLLHTSAIQAMDLITAELAESGYVVETSGPYPAGEAPTFPYVIVRPSGPTPNADASSDFGGYFNVYPYAKTSGGAARP